MQWIDFSPDGLSRYFGEQALRPIDYIELDWSEEQWRAGCVSALAPGVLTSVRHVLREPAGRMHWARTETSDVWNGYIDGAVRSGKPVADEAIGLLASAAPRSDRHLF